MKTNLNDKFEWHRIFKILPVKTQDGFRVAFDHVWRKQIENWVGKTEYVYHTNPDGLEDKFQDDVRARIMNKLTEGSMLHRRRNPMPPVKRPKRPPPPPSPPRGRRIGGEDITMEKILGAWDDYQRTMEKEDNVCPDCGTVGCYKGPAKFDVSGAGVLHAKSEDIMKSCKTRQQLRALEKLNIGGRRKSTLGEPKELPKNQKLGFYKPMSDDIE